MKKVQLIIYILFLSIGIVNANYAEGGKVLLKGKVTSKQTGESIVGAYIYFPDLKTGTVTGLDGSYEIDNLPSIKTLIQVKELGFKTFVKVVDLSSTSNLDVALEESVIEANEVVITGTSKSTEIKRSPVPIAPINQTYLQQNTSTNIIDAIAKVPGVSALTTGPNVSKPYIHGLGSNRVLTLYDGVRQEGQQWGDEHGIEIDQYSVDHIEVVKGPASLIYGSDALAGVVNFLPPNHLPVNTIKGDVITNYQTNNGLYAGSANLAGNSDGWNWGTRFTNKVATNYQNKYDGRVFGTAFHETDINSNLGLNRSWGYSHLNFNLYDDTQEIPDGSRDSTTRQFTKRTSALGNFKIVKPEELNSYKISDIHQRVQHYRLYSANSFFLGESRLDVKLSYQQSVRREYSHPEAPSIPGLYLTLHTTNYDIKYNFSEHNGIESTIGVNGMYQINNTEKATEFIIPNYQLFDFGPFAYVNKNVGKWDFAAGARYDVRIFGNSSMYTMADPATGYDMQVNGADITKAGVFHKFLEYKHIFSGFSGSLGATYNLTDNFGVKANLARGFRAPNISEISANGIHPGTGFEQLGNGDFKPEFSLQEDVGVFFDSKHISINAEMFNNIINNYIYDEKLQSIKGGDSIISNGGSQYSVFKFRQTEAQLYGGEVSIDIHPHPLDWLHIENSLSLVQALNLGGNGAKITDSTKYLPYIPPFHTNSELRAEFRKGMGCFTNIFVKIGVQYYAAQKQAFLAYGTETPTLGYTLFDGGIGANITSKTGKTLFIFIVFGTNLSDIAYQSNMSRLKYMDNYPVNYTGRSGIYNMGRNISFKLIIPIDVRKGA